MGHRVVGDLAAAQHDLTGHFGIHLGRLSEQEEGAFSFFLLEDVEDFPGRSAGSVVEGQGDITSAVEEYRALLGPDNGSEPVSASTGRREINWDGVPDSLASPNAYPPEFFNAATAPRARGAVVHTPALVRALNSGRLGGAGIHVFEKEPLPPDDPLLACDQVVLTPHCADMTLEGVDLLNSGAVDNVIAYLKGEPIHRVT